MSYIVDGTMTSYSAEAKRAGQAVAACGVDSGSTGTYVWFAYCGPKAQTDRNPYVLIIKTSLSPHAVIGKAFSQSPACGDETAFKRAVLYGFTVLRKSVLTVCFRRGLSHSACWCVGRLSASLDSVLDLHSDVMDSTCASGVTRIEVRMRVCRRRVLAAEAKKAGCDSEDALRMAYAQTTHLYVSEACVH